MQARASEQQHDDEHRVLSSSTNSSTTDERLCEPIALPSGGALVRAAPNSEVFDRRSRPPSAPPAPDTTLLPSSSADLRVLRIPPGIDHPGGTMLVKTTKHYALHFTHAEDEGSLEGTLEPVKWQAPDGSMMDTAHCWTIAARESTDIEVWSDSDWAGDRHSRRSTLSAVVKACGTTVAAKSRKSKMVCLSSCEAELDAAVLAMRLALDVCGLQLQLRTPPSTWAAHTPLPPMPFWIDNQAALSVIQNDVRGRNRHFDIRIMFIRLNIDISKFLVSYCPTDQNVADGGTKALNRVKQFESAQRLLGLPAFPALDRDQQHL